MVLTALVVAAALSTGPTKPKAEVPIDSSACPSNACTVPVALYLAAKDDEERQVTAARARMAAWALLATSGTVLATGFVLRFGFADPLFRTLPAEIAAYNSGVNYSLEVMHSINDRIDRLAALDASAMAAWIVSGVALAASVGLFIFAPSPNGKTSTRLSVSAAPGPGGAFGTLTLSH